MDTNANSSGAGSSRAPKNWAWWAALAMVAAGTLAVLYVVFAASSKPEQTAGLTRFASGDMQRLIVMPDPPPITTRTLRDAQGAETNLQAYDGEIIVVNLWATWCAPCLEEMPSLAALQQRYEGRLRVVPISVDSEAELPRAQTELARLSGGALPFLSDMTRGVLFDLQAPGMPVTILYDREGREVARLAGGADWGGEDAARVIDAVVAEE